ncbi:RAD55 family ATPase [Salinibaculum rarum]|uniref:RAD55 family ATPase n=1 Tax=Salinibaculum rarum TaxID=3058903 RepID=UPI00265F8EF0|nr:ATPase domain-containing protein [Salinibaculum sp. KK48]
MSRPQSRLSTGIDAIDRHMSGGIEPGSVVALIAGPTMQSEAILHQLVEMHQTLYLTTLRQASAVENDLERLSTDDVFVEYAGADRTMNNEFLRQITGSRSYKPSFTNDTSLLDTVYEILQDLDQKANVVLDPVNPMEESENKDAYREVLNELKSTMLDTGGVGILHCITLDELPPFRDVTLALADVVWELDLVSLASSMEYQLSIPKNRGGKPVLDDISIVLEKDVWVDESRNI